ncbi:PA0069 family radical SAM protein [Urechidicola vernalis]|uniref:PA0069 family radical SAM protein n=1 Tax=Urechidicola vernalis TaxID=3075600 RepID=A0ABU2Y4X3_9FLAO|nr:PA0069 family radical SAM protein [Urechidicola sp. P050]MDT0552704.1 PA0069 family radical SAM protein [Urechidicola sp. P050]
MKKQDFIKGRGAQKQVQNRFLQHSHVVEDEYLNYAHIEGEPAQSNRTQYIEIFPKSILNKVTSTDIGMAYSMNPYQGCEHGCIYCYARNSHEYYGYDAGLDFEKKILFKQNSAELLEKKITSRNWKAENIMFSGNTDCYQPIERKLEITRSMLQVLLKYKHPVSIITKNSLVLRDLDILKKMAALNLVHVAISITSLSEDTRRLLEPRTSSIKQRLKTLETLSKNGIPVNVMMAPIIPGLNNHEVFNMVETVSTLGAKSVAYTMVRLNGTIGEVFTDWVQKTLPDRASKIINQIKEVHGGSLNDSRFGVRMKGEGKIAEQVALQFRLAKKKYLAEVCMPPLNYDLFDKSLGDAQMKLF